MELHEKLKELRVVRGYSQSQISELMGKSKSWYSNIEQGIRKIDAHDLFRIASIFDVDISEIYQSIEEKTREH